MALTAELKTWASSRLSESSLSSDSAWAQIARWVQDSVDRSLSQAAMDHGTVVIANPVNPASYPWFAMLGVQSKSMDIRGRTERSGLLAGLVTQDDRLPSKPLQLMAGGKLLSAVRREQKEIWTENLLSTDQPLEACYYPSGELVTSDIDLVLIAGVAGSDQQPCSEEHSFGQLVAYERHYIERANAHFQTFLDEGSSFRLLAHGPSSRFSGTRRSHLHFPMTVYYRDGRVEKIGSEEDREGSIAIFQSLCFELSKQGFVVNWNPLWDR